MEVQFGPNPVDEANLLYKLQRKIKVFNTNNPLPNRGYNLVTSSSKYGIVFVGSPDGTLSAYYLKELVDNECEPKYFTIKLQEKPTHIAVSCDHELLAVTGGQLLCVYKVVDFQNNNVSPSLTIKCDVNLATFVSALQWNPCIPDTIAIAFYDGTLLMAQVATSQVKKVTSLARCICWSPKGKQLVTGNSDGTLTQHKPDLTPIKTIPAPMLFEGSPVEALAVFWISTFQFAVVYKNSGDSSRPAVTMINTPKAGKPLCINYEDICYSMGSNRPWYYYLQGVAQWNMILSSSSNSMEIATLGSADGAAWVQWCQPDEARPELPLTDKKKDNYPVGVCFDTCAVHQLPWGENATLPHMPLLHVISQTGLLTIFNVINLKDTAVQVCTPPQQLTLPAAAMTSVVPGDAPAQPTPTPAPTTDAASVAVVLRTPEANKLPTVQPTLTAPMNQTQSAPGINQFGAPTSNATNLPGYTQLRNTLSTPQGFAAATTQHEQRPVHTKPASLPQPQTTVVQTPVTPAAPKPQPPPQAQENAALKAEQERINEIKANQELKNILVKEVNDFQTELYKFMVKTRETQAKLQRDIESINESFNFNSLDTEQLKKDCMLEDLRGAIVQLKLELVRACAVVAEARTHAEAKDYDQWTQADLLTTKRVASVKKLAYYVHTQLEQAQRAFDYKWSEAISKDPKYNKPGQRMIRPVLDDVYQPLVKQQEVLGRQQAVLRTLRATLADCDVTPMFKSTSLLRSTPFKNKDPLSKLTKNILNMSIDSTITTKQPLLSASKLDALRDMLSNHKTVKIKHVNVEIQEHLETMKLNYKMSMKEKAEAKVKMEPRMNQTSAQPTYYVPKVEMKSEVPTVEIKTEKSDSMKKPSLTVTSMNVNIPASSPAGHVKPVGLPHVARTLFTDEPKPEPQKPTVQPQVQPQPQVRPQQFKPQAVPPQPARPQPPQPQPPQPQMAQPQSVPPQLSKPSLALGFTTTTAAASANTRSVLKDLLQNKQANNEAKNDANAFMGQPICSPSTFAFSTPSSTTSTAAPSAVFTSKPISEISNMFNKFQPQAIVPEPKPQAPVPDLKPQAFASPPSSETGEPEATVTKTVTIKPKTEKPLTNLFAMKTPTPLTSSPNVPDVLKSTQDVKSETTKSVVKEKSKENASESGENVTQKPAADKKETAKPLAAQPTNISIPVNASLPRSNKQADIAAESKVQTPKVSEQSETPASSASSIFAAANAATPTSPKPQKPDSPTTPTLNIPRPEAATSETSDGTSSISSLDSCVATLSQPSFVPTTTPSAASIFGAAVASQPKTPPSQAGSIFAAGAASPPAFGATQGSVFGNSATQSIFGSATTKPSVFSSPTPASPSSVFGAAAQTGSIFGSPTTQASTAPPTPTPSVFGSSSTTSVFGAASTTPSSVFGTSPATTASVFGTTTPTTEASGFGAAATSTPSAFTPTSTQESLFGATTTTTQSIFGSTTSSKASVFSGSGTSIFGAGNNQASVFGASSTPASVFGASTPSTQASVFGAAAPASQASVFGTAPTTQASVFGTPPTTQASVFGSAPTTQASVFGTAPTTQASVFGSTPTTQASVFGVTPTTTAQSGSIFGGAEMNMFASASISTTSAPSQTSGGSIFGTGSPGSVFGSSNTNVFGGKSSFGQPNPTAAAIFGGGGATTFGQKPATDFWSGGNSNGEGGFGSTGFGQQATTQASSIFGGSGGSFSTPSPAGQAFGSPQPGGPFSGGDNNSAFGSPQQQASSGFGGAAGFGAKPAFGQPSGFGSPPSGGGFGSGFGGFNKSPGGSFGASATFGGSPTFGGTGFGGSSPSKMFGGPAPTGFGATQSNATFENLATQNTLTFGNLAQQSGQPPQAAPTFNTSPSFTGWRG